MTGVRKTSFDFIAGTKKNYLSAAQIISFKKGNSNLVILIFRDEERGIVQLLSIPLLINNWQLKDVTTNALVVGAHV